MNSIFKLLRFLIIAASFCLCRTASAIQLPLLFDTTTLQIIIPTNILGMQFGNQFLTNLAGFGLTNIGGNLRVDTNVVGGLYTPTLKWEGITINNPNFKDTAQIYHVQSGSDWRVYITQGGVGLQEMESMNQGLIGRYTNTFGIPQRIEVIAPLFFDQTNGTLSATLGTSATNGTPLSVDAGSVLPEANIQDSPEIGASVTGGSNIVFTVVVNSLATNKFDSTVLDLLLNQFRVNNLTNWFLGITNSATVTWSTNANGDWIATASGGGGGSGTNAFVNGVLQQPIRHTNSTDISWSDLGGSNWGLSINDSAFYSRLTNSLIASNNIAIAYDGSTHKVMLSAITSGGTGTAVTVDGGSDLTRANLADASTTFLFDLTTTNVTGRLPDRDFGDITVGSSGAGMTINANSVALGTDTTGNYVATVAGTANKVDVSGSGSETAAVTVTLSDTIDIGGHSSFEIPNSASPTTDAFGEIAGDNNAWAASRGALQFFDGTANTYLVGTLASDTPSNGQVPTWNTGGTITWETPSAGGGSLTVNGSLVSTPNLTNSNTLIWNVSGTNISATVTNVPGSTTQNVVQRVGGVLFYNSTGTTQSNESYFGIATNVLINAAGGGVPLQATVSLSGAASTNYVVVVEPYDANGVYAGASAAFSVRDKTTSGFQFTAEYSGAALAGVWYRVWILDTVSVGGSGGDVISTANNTFTATNTFNGPIVFGGGFTTTNLFAPQRQKAILHENEWVIGQAASSGNWGLPSLQLTAISSGTFAVQNGTDNHPGLVRLSSASGANSGGSALSSTATLFSQVGLTWESITRPLNTNAGARVYLGFQDSTSAGAATDGIHLFRSNNIIIPQVYHNGTLTQGSEYTISSNQFLRTKIAVTASNSARFVVVDSDSGTAILDETITTTLPDSSSRLFGIGWKGFYTNAAAAALEDIDWTTAYFDRPISR